MNNNSVRTVVLVFGVTLFFISSAVAQSQQKGEGEELPTFKQLIKDMDNNEDGKLSKDEIKGPLKKDFAKVDTNEDGFITAGEFAKAPKHERGPKKRN